MNIFNKTIAVLINVVFLYGLFPGWAFAQNWTDPAAGSINGFNRSVFDYHFSRADRELDPERWLIEAKYGIKQAVAAWEIVACGLYDNPYLFDEAKNKLEKWSSEELELRFSQWLIRRFVIPSAVIEGAPTAAAFFVCRVNQSALR